MKLRLTATELETEPVPMQYSGLGTLAQRLNATPDDYPSGMEWEKHEKLRQNDFFNLSNIKTYIDQAFNPHLDKK